MPTPAAQTNRAPASASVASDARLAKLSYTNICRPPLAAASVRNYLRSHDEDKRTDIVPAEFLIHVDGDGRYRYAFGDPTCAVLRSNEALPTIDEVRASIERLRGRLRTEQWARRHAAVDGSGYWFEIIDGDGTPLATSIGFQSRFAREVAIERLQLDAQSALVRARW